MVKVSVIMPNFNNVRYISEAIDSVLNQTLEDIELIVIDDCSTDDSFQVLQEFANKDKRIRVIRNETNLGAGLSRNKGLDIAIRRIYKFFRCRRYI